MPLTLLVSLCLVRCSSTSTSSMPAMIIFWRVRIILLNPQSRPRPAHSGHRPLLRLAASLLPLPLLGLLLLGRQCGGRRVGIRCRCHLLGCLLLLGCFRLGCLLGCLLCCLLLRVGLVPGVAEQGPSDVLLAALGLAELGHCRLQQSLPLQALLRPHLRLLVQHVAPHHQHLAVHEDLVSPLGSALLLLVLLLLDKLLLLLLVLLLLSRVHLHSSVHRDEHQCLLQLRLRRLKQLLHLGVVLLLALGGGEQLSALKQLLARRDHCLVEVRLEPESLLVLLLCLEVVLLRLGARLCGDHHGLGVLGLLRRARSGTVKQPPRLAHVHVAPVQQRQRRHFLELGCGLLKERRGLLGADGGLQRLVALLQADVVQVHVPVRVDAQVLAEQLRKVQQPVVKLHHLLALRLHPRQLKGYGRGGRGGRGETLAKTGTSQTRGPQRLGLGLMRRQTNGHRLQQVLARGHRDQLVVAVAVLQLQVAGVLGELAADDGGEVGEGQVAGHLDHARVAAEGHLQRQRRRRLARLRLLLHGRDLLLLLHLHLLLLRAHAGGVRHQRPRLGALLLGGALQRLLQPVHHLLRFLEVAAGPERVRRQRAHIHQRLLQVALHLVRARAPQQSPPEVRGNLQGLIALMDDLVELVVAQVASGAVAVEEGAVGVSVGGHAESLRVGSKRLHVLAAGEVRVSLLLQLVRPLQEHLVLGPLRLHGLRLSLAHVCRELSSVLSKFVGKLSRSFLIGAELS
mmetsp:Transcript_10254/g.17647  ORF Transcript_10254/g.17647 Transcript_10254/m.17647 type:complete len:738 (+) Transcript_10254:631-2844(+)